MLFLFYASLIALILGLYRPAIVKLSNRKRVAMIFLPITLVCLILQSPSSEEPSQAQVSTTGSIVNQAPDTDTNSASRSSSPTSKTTTDVATTPTNAPSNTISDTESAAPDPFVPKYKPSSQAVSLNGGIGDTFNQMSSVYGGPTRTNQAMQEGLGLYNYQNDLYVVMYTGARVQGIAVQLDVHNMTMSEKSALAMAKKMMPSDATLVKTVDSDQFGDREYIYHSKTLESLFDNDWFKGGDGKIHPGQFLVALTHDGDTVESFQIAVGTD